MATIRDVAEFAHVSVTTVSHVLNGTRAVDPETEQRVRQAIQALGYRPNLLARGLRRRQTQTIGLLVPDNSNPFFAEVSRAIEDAGFAQGYNVILCNSDLSEAKQAAYIDVLLSKQVDGILLIASGSRPDPVRHIASVGVPVVIVDRELEDTPADLVLVDHEQGGYLAGQYLVERGHRKIACISGPEEVTPSTRRVAGFRRALAEAGIDLDPNAVVQGDGRLTGGSSAMQELLARGLTFTALFAYNDLMAIGAIGVLRRAGLSIPEDVSVIGFDNILQAGATVPGLTTVAQPITEIGSLSVDLLLRRIRGRSEAEPVRVTLPTKLVERESCAVLPDLTGQVA
ncbi:MAG: LacI family transcriptional regulator [Chloroflexota bacterium]|nr:LacI family transcriptional regulator [Chloroflexota bacterium]